MLDNGQFDAQTPTATPGSVQLMIDDAQTRVPGARLIAVMPQANDKAPFVVFMRHEDVAADGGEIPTDAIRVYSHPADGSHIETRVPPPNRTAGDWFIWSMKPFHFGTDWGFAMKIVWALLGLSIPVLTITGALIYWNRSLSKLWSRRKKTRRHELVATGAVGAGRR